MTWLVAMLLGLSGFGLGLYLPGSLSAQTFPSYIHTAAGGGSATGADGDAALAVRLNRAEGLATVSDSAVYVADSFHHRVWKVTGAGTLVLVVGTGVAGFSGDEGPARHAQLNVPEGLATGPDGSLYIGDTVNRRVRKIGPDGVITTVAGTGERGFSGDGGPATEARLTDPYDLAVAPDGTLYILDEKGGEVRRVTTGGTIETVPMDVPALHPSDLAHEQGPPEGAPKIHPFGIAVNRAGRLYVSDGTGHRVWQLLSDTRWAVLAGTSAPGAGGDGGPAELAQLNRPEGLAIGPDGSVYVADRNNHRVRRVTPDGTMMTTAGTGEQGFGGDGGPAIAGRMDQPLRVAVGPGGTLFVNDLGNERVRVVSRSGAWPLAPTTTSTTYPALTTTSTTITTTSTTTVVDTATTTVPTTLPQVPPSPRPTAPPSTVPRRPVLPTTVPRKPVTSTTTVPRRPVPSTVPRRPVVTTTIHPEHQLTPSTTVPRRPVTGPTTGPRHPGPTTTVPRRPVASTTSTTSAPGSASADTRQPSPSTSITADGAVPPAPPDDADVVRSPTGPSRPPQPSPGTTLDGRPSGSSTTSTTSVSRKPASPPETPGEPGSERSEGSSSEEAARADEAGGQGSSGPFQISPTAWLVLAMACVAAGLLGLTVWSLIRYRNV